ncbi:hypothetical protein Tco_1176693 [Tanacetum coccineum]
MSLNSFTSPAPEAGYVDATGSLGYMLPPGYLSSLILNGFTTMLLSDLTLEKELSSSPVYLAVVQKKGSKWLGDLCQFFRDIGSKGAETKSSSTCSVAMEVRAQDLGEAAFILGIKIYRDRSKRLIGLCQNAYMDKILKRYKMDNSKRGHIPMQERLDLNKHRTADFNKNPGNLIGLLGLEELQQYHCNVATRLNNRKRHQTLSGISLCSRCVELGEIRILKVHTDNNLADPFTKALSNRKLTQHAKGMGLRPASSFM